MLTPPHHAERIGPHWIWIEGDMCVTVIDGDTTPEHVIAMQRKSRLLFDEFGFILSLVDARQAGTITPEARRLSASYQREHPVPGAVAVFGVGAVLRAINALYSRAVAYLTNSQREMALFQTEAEARAWLDGQRRRLRRPPTSP